MPSTETDNFIEVRAKLEEAFSALKRKKLCLGTKVLGEAVALEIRK